MTGNQSVPAGNMMILSQMEQERKKIASVDCTVQSSEMTVEGMDQVHQISNIILCIDALVLKLDQKVSK